MNKQDIENKLRVIIVDRIGVDPSDVGTDTNLINDLGCDSLDIIELVMDVEREFGFHVENDEVQEFNKFSQAVAFIESKLV